MLEVQRDTENMEFCTEEHGDYLIFSISLRAPPVFSVSYPYNLDRRRYDLRGISTANRGHVRA